MGFALAKVAAKLGAEVILISGPSEEKINHPSISLLNVTSADMMFKEIKKYYESGGIIISSVSSKTNFCIIPRTVAPFGGRASPCQGEGRGFKSRLSLKLLEWWNW